MGIELGRIYNEDCLETMKRMEDKSVDLIVTDPPYGIGVCDMKLGMWAASRMDKGDWDASVPSGRVFSEMMRVSVHQSVWGGNYFPLPSSRGWFVWDKGEGFRGRSYSEAELCWTSLDSPTRIYVRDPLANRDYIGKEHPTQKPVPLIEWCISKFGDIETVYDPFMGSGTTAVACERLGRKWLGSEINPDYCRIAEKRIEAVRAQGNLFEATP
jgi:site-specific DNA-methyltransferase (adenine-specific)